MIVYIYFLVLFLLNLTSKLCDALEDHYYECGSHGRFEYCIDDIPGCVIGCHCYPGYYFDTETKICEPNIKLSHDYRRRYFGDPTRMPAKTIEVISTPVPTKDPIDEKVDAIAQDADDLGDWLYNQFFKTVENQVINKTETEPIIRRSGTSGLQPVLNRRSRRRPKKKRRKGRVKKKGLKQRLLRITKDDSLFDSSSADDTDDTSSSSSSDSSDSSDTSLEKVTFHDNKGHAHRKIVMINKKPTPALPSFIFLPNVDTPFYPPIGLPPPPIMPMYPMVPIPPVIAVTPNCDKKDTTITSNSTTTSPNATTSTTTSPNIITTTMTTTTTTSTTTTTTTTTTTVKPNTIAPNALRKLRNKMKKKNKKPQIPPFTGDFPGEESPFMDDMDSPIQLRPPVYDDPPPLEDVDFKYLAELIHKVDLNKTKPNFIFTPNEKHDNKIDLSNFNQAITHRNQQVQNPPFSDYKQLHHKQVRPASKADDLSESFYSNLGKQIATLIRKKVDEGKSQFDVEVEKNRDKSPTHTIFNENRFSPRSYWERFVRSPLKYRQTLMMNEDLNDPNLNGKDLFYLEDRVNVAAADEKVLSLQELENIASTMVVKENEIPKKVLLKLKHPAPRLSQIVDNNLLPPVAKQNEKDNNNINTMKNTVRETLHRNNATNDFNIHLGNFQMYNNYNNRPRHEEVSTAKSNVNTPKLFHHQVSGIVPRNMNIPVVNIAHHILKYQLNPIILNHKNSKYVGDNRSFQVQQAMGLPIFSQHDAVKPRHPEPSYFLNEFEHFNYFDS